MDDLLQGESVFRRICYGYVARYSLVYFVFRGKRVVFLKGFLLGDMRVLEDGESFFLEEQTYVC